MIVFLCIVSKNHARRVCVLLKMFNKAPPPIVGQSCFLNINYQPSSFVQTVDSQYLTMECMAIESLFVGIYSGRIIMVVSLSFSRDEEFVELFDCNGFFVKFSFGFDAVEELDLYGLGSKFFTYFLIFEHLCAVLLKHVFGH